MILTLTHMDVICNTYRVGDGFNVYPVFANDAFTEEISPFLMLDYGAPKTFEPTRARRGVGAHPHRGIETVTIAYHGEVEHGDSIGNRGVIGPGDVQVRSSAFHFHSILIPVL
jgi:redox-sensitive bicupin YhaK (pirin superfamily)